MRSSPTLRRALIALAPLLVYTGLTLLLFRPLLPDLATGLRDRSDTTLNTWIIAWQAHALPRDPLALFNAPIFHPLPDTLALSEILWPLAPLAVPLLAATGNPVLTYNLLFLSVFPLAGLGAYLLALQVTGCAFSVQRSTFNVQRLSAFLAGLIYAFSPHQFGHLSQLQLLSIAWLPLTLLFLDRFWTRGRTRDGALFALCAALQTLSAFYYGFQVALAVGLYVVVRLGVGGWGLGAGGRRSGRVGQRSAVGSRRSAVGEFVHRLFTLLPWLVLAALLIAPFALPYLRMRGELGLERSVGETVQNAATLGEWVRPPAANPLYRALPGLASAEGGLFPGLAVLMLAALGVVAGKTKDQRRRTKGDPDLASVVGRPSSVVRGYWLLLGLVAVVLSLGPRLKLTAGDPGGLALPFGWLYEHVPGMTAIRAPGRFANTAFLALAMLAALGAAWLLGKLSCTSLRRGKPARPALLPVREGPAQEIGPSGPPILGGVADSPRSRGVRGAFSPEGAVAARAEGVRFGLAALLALAILAEYAGGMGRFAVQPMPPIDAPLYAWLSTQPPATIVELPLTSEMAGVPAGKTGTGAADAWPDYNLLRYQYFQTGHWQPTVDGYSGFVPPHHRELGLTLAHFPDARSLALLRGLGVERVIVHSEVMDAFQPGRAAALREALAGTRGVVVEREFGPEWVYRLLPGPQTSRPVAGRFWSTEDGQAFLLLASADGPDVVIPPGSPLRVQGSWQPARGRAAQPFEASVLLPLMVGAGNVVPLDLPRPAADGVYALRLEASDPRIVAAPYEQDVSVKAGANPAKLLAIQAGTLNISSTATSADPARGSIPVLQSDARSIGLNQRAVGDALSQPLADAVASRMDPALLSSREIYLRRTDTTRYLSFPDVLRFAPGQPVTLTLPWRLLDRPDGDASVSARILDANGQMLAQDDRALSGGRDLVRAWQPGMTVITTHALRLPDAPGRYTFQAFLYRPDDPTDLFFLDEAGEPASSLGWPLRVKPPQVTTTPLSPPGFLARFGDPSGDEIYLLAQHDAPPQDGRYPTSAWDGGEVVTDTLEISQPPALAGQTACLRLGLYDPVTGARLVRLDAAGDDWQDAKCWMVDDGR